MAQAEREAGGVEPAPGGALGEDGGVTVTKDDFNKSYVGSRPDVQRLVWAHARSVLDVGCSTGSLGAAIKARTGAHVVGIEVSEQMAAIAAERLDKVFVGDAAALISGEQLGGRVFDTIIFADILEHLVDPWGTLAAARQYLQEEGVIIASIPNVRHFDTIFSLVVRGRWPHRDRGIHDRTHLRFFTRKDMLDLFAQAGLAVERIEANYRVTERVHRVNRIAKYVAVPGIREFLAFQYVMRARNARGSV